MTRLIAAVAGSILSLSLMIHQSAADDWPTRPVRIVVPFAAGGAADMYGRLIADALSTSIGQKFVVENRAGGGGVVGTESVARSEPDGYTLLISGLSSHVIGTAMNKSATFDPVRDFTHIAHLGGSPNVFIVNPSLGVKTFQEFLALARTQKDGLSYMSSGVGTAGNLVAEYLAAKEKIELRHVPYKGGGPALVDIIAGHVKVGSITFSITRPHIESGKLIPIAISSAERLQDYPQLPTLKELGHPDLDTVSWFSLSGPAKLPTAIVDRLNREFNKALSLPHIRQRLDDENVIVTAMTPEQFTAFVRSEVDKWTPVVRATTGK